MAHSHASLIFAAAGLLAIPVAAQLPPSTTGDLLVSSSSNDRLLRLAFDGSTLKEYTYPGLRHPRGIARTPDGELFVASQNSGEILVLDAQMRLLRRFPVAPIVSPTGLALGPNGNLFVSGFRSADVGEFTRAGRYLRRFTGGGLGGTNCAAFAPDGSFYAASAFTGRVVHFAANGSVIRSFTGFGLSSPMGIAIWGNELFVAGGGSNNIVVFGLDGTAKRQIRHVDISGPQGVAFSAGGELVTSGFYNDKIAWFTRAGQHLRTVLPPNSDVPRSLAYLTSATLEANGQPTLGQPFAMQFEVRHEAGSLYATPMALATAPGLQLPDGRRLPIAADPLFNASLGGAPTFNAFTGRLDASGRARPTLTLPQMPALRGLGLHLTGITLDANHPTLIRQVSPRLSLTVR